MPNENRKKAPGSAPQEDRIARATGANLIRYLRRHHGQPIVDEVFERAGVSPDQILQGSRWIPHEAYCRLWSAAVAVVDDPELGLKVGSETLNISGLRGMAFAMRVLGIMGGPGSAIRSLPRMANRLSNCVHYQLINSGHSRAIMSVSEPAGGPFGKERCDLRIGAVTSLAGKASPFPENVTVGHPQCIGRGDPACIYDIRWTAKPVGQWVWFVAVAAILAAVYSLAWWAALPLPGAVLLLALSFLVVLFLGVGRQRSMRLQESLFQVQDQRQRILEVNQLVEERNRELADAFTDLEERTQELGQVRAKLEHQQRLTSMGRLVAGVAHELNNPLAAIQLRAEAVAACDDLAEVPAMTTTITDMVERCRGLIRNMLDFSRETPGTRQDVDPAQLVQDTRTLLSPVLTQADIEATWSMGTDYPPVRGDRGQLQQVLVNVLENAADALRHVPQPRQISIDVQFVEDQRIVRFDLRDNGPGVPADIREQIFDPFMTTKDVGEGTGLGLSICHGIVAAHGGQIQLVQTDDGTGALFRIDLPCSESRIVEGASHEHLDLPMNGQVADRSFRLLVIEDEPMLLETITQLLEIYGHQVRGAADANEARDLLDGDDPPDAILLDLWLPGESGQQFHHTLPEDLQARVVFMTGAINKDEPFAERFHDRFLEKPFSYHEFKQALSRLPGPAEADAP